MRQRSRQERNPIELSEAINEGSNMVIQQLKAAGYYNIDRRQAKVLLAQPIRQFISNSSFSIVSKPKQRNKNLIVMVKTK